VVFATIIAYCTPDFERLAKKRTTGTEQGITEVLDAVKTVEARIGDPAASKQSPNDVLDAVNRLDERMQAIECHLHQLTAKKRLWQVAGTAAKRLIAGKGRA
jgi:hypothetical protein